VIFVYELDECGVCPVVVFTSCFFSGGVLGRADEDEAVVFEVVVNFLPAWQID